MRGRSGFTLVELSIVIVIIGLIVAGVMAGQSLVHSSKLRRISTDVEQYRMAMNTFKLQYDAVPGDMRNATAYWGGATADGNGDRAITWETEGYRGWQQLTLSGILPGSYTGTSTGNTAVPGVNAPAGPLGNSCYTLIAEGQPPTSVYISGGGYFNYINYGIYTPIYPCTNPLLLTKDALALDQKMDDGIHSRGKVRVRLDTGGGLCVSGANYDLTRTVPSCTMVFVFGNF